MNKFYNEILIDEFQDFREHDFDLITALAKEIINSRKAKNKLYETKAQINSIMMSLQQQLCKYINL